MRNVGITKFAIKLGNYLAKKEKLLYLTFNEYEEKIRFMASEMESDRKVENNFEVYSANEFCLETYLDILSLIEKNNYSTIIIDNLNSLYSIYHRSGDGECDINMQIRTIIDSLHFMIRQFKCRIILVHEINDMRYSFSDDFCRAKLNDFVFHRHLVNNCNQILFYNYPYLKGYIEDSEGESMINRIELYSLKNENHTEEILILDNSKLNIFKPKVNIPFL
jgi:hypothetical protein